MSKNLPAITPGSKPPSLPSRATVTRLTNITETVDRWVDRILPFEADPKASPEQRARPSILVGLGIMFMLFVFVGSWMAFWPLATGAISPGKIVSDSSRKEIQHLEGGIVKEVLVREGDLVKADQVLVRLDNTTAQARSDLLRGQYITELANEARLTAERDGADAPAFPEELLSQEANDTKVRETLDTQRRLFATRREAVEGEVNVLNQKIAQSDEEINGLKEQISSANRQISLLDEEIKTVSGLLSAGNATKPRLLALKRAQAELVGTRGQSQAMIARAEQTINEAKIGILNRRTDFLNKVVAELKETQVRLSDLSEQMRASSDVVRRIEIKAPIAGSVTGLKVHTVGGVVRPGDTIMTLVPKDDKLIVESRVAPIDIDWVHEGLDARVRLTAFKQRNTPPVMGKVVTISADRFDDPRTGEGYFIARIEIPPSELKKLGKLEISAGMPAEALIITGRRTMLSYLVSPIRDSFSRAFREQ